jgi:plasmid stabilization system protein ParE
MPYKQKQARAIFLAIKRKKGTKAAKAFGRKHRASFRNSAKRRKR